MTRRASGDSRVSALLAQLEAADPKADPVQYASRCHQLAMAVAGEPGDRSFQRAKALLEHGVDRLGRAGAAAAHVGWLEYGLADLHRGAPQGDLEENRDAAIKLLERAGERGLEAIPVLYARVWGSLGDLYARRRRGDRADNQRRALDAYETALRMPPPLMPEKEWAINSHHYGLTLLECETGDLIKNAAEALLAHWQAAVAGQADDDLHSRAIRGCGEALDELATRLRSSDELTPFEVALPPSGGSSAGGDDFARVRAVVGVMMTDLRPLLMDDQVVKAGKTWELVAEEAADAGMKSLEGVAHLNFGRLLRRLAEDHQSTEDRESARQHVSQASLLIDPMLHPWAWARVQQELAAAWSPGGESR
jgi:hypothetical protein